MKDKIKVLFDTDVDGYITGWQQEFYDGRQWQTPFDTTNAVELTQTEIGTIVLGATRYTDGKLVVDESKQTQPVTPQPTTDQKMLAAVMLRVAKLEASA